MSLEMAHKVILPPKKNYIPQFLKQRDINSYYLSYSKGNSEEGFVAYFSWTMLDEFVTSGTNFSGQ
jgi:hypothetical protein